MQAPKYDVQFLRSEALRSSSSSSRTWQIKECKTIISKEKMDEVKKTQKNNAAFNFNIVTEQNLSYAKFLYKQQ